MNEKHEHHSPISFANYLLHNAVLQDSLLQSYRNLHLTLQSILLAIATGLVVTIFTIGDPLKAKALLIIQSIFTFIGIIVLWEMYKIIRTRGKDVSYWHERLIEAEQKLPNSYRDFMHFKVHQKLRRKDSEYLQEMLVEDVDIDRDDIEILVGKGLGHTRKVIDRWLSIGMIGLWIVLLATSIIFVFTPKL